MIGDTSTFRSAPNAYARQEERVLVDSHFTPDKQSNFASTKFERHESEAGDKG